MDLFDHIIDQRLRIREARRSSTMVQENDMLNTLLNMMVISKDEESRENQPSLDKTTIEHLLLVLIYAPSVSLNVYVLD